MKFIRLNRLFSKTTDFDAGIAIKLKSEELDNELRKKVAGLSINEWLSEHCIQEDDWEFEEGSAPIRLNLENVLWAEPYFPYISRGLLADPRYLPEITKIYLKSGKAIIVKEKYKVIDNYLP